MADGHILIGRQFEGEVWVKASDVQKLWGLDAQRKMQVWEAYTDALNAVDQIMNEPLTSITIGKPGGCRAIIDDIVGEIKRRRDLNAGGK